MCLQARLRRFSMGKPMNGRSHFCHRRTRKAQQGGLAMRRLLFGLAAAGLALAPATAALPVGTKAPDFTTTGAVGGKEFKLHLAEQLKKGPVVLYFFPKAFTSGCTAEAHAFSESIGDFKKAGAEVIGMSADDLKTLKDF